MNHLDKRPTFIKIADSFRGKGKIFHWKTFVGHLKISE